MSVSIVPRDSCRNRTMNQHHRISTHGKPDVGDQISSRFLSETYKNNQLKRFLAISNALVSDIEQGS